MNSLLIQYTKSLSIKHLKSTIIPFKSRIQMYSSEEVIDPSDTVLTIPNTERQVKETLEMKKQRLLYQSKRRGMLENDLLFGSFASKYLDSFSKEETDIYDMLINKPSNEWDLYYWATGVKPIPQEFQNKIMDLLVEHCNNLYKEHVANKS